MKARMVVHLVNGNFVAGSTADITPQQSQEAKDSFAEIFQSKEADGWQVNIQSENGSWAVFPKQSVLYVELEVLDGN